MARHRGKEPNQAIDAATVGGALAAIAALPILAHLSVYFFGEPTSIATLASIEALVFGLAMLFYLHDRAITSPFAAKTGRRLFFLGCLLPVLALFANYIYVGDMFVWAIARPHPFLAAYFVITATCRGLFSGGMLAAMAVMKQEERAANASQHSAA